MPGFATTTPDQLKDAPDINVNVRSGNPPDDVTGPASRRTFALRAAGDDFSAAGDIPCDPAMIGGNGTDREQSVQEPQAVAGLCAAAVRKRDAVNAPRRK